MRPLEEWRARLETLPMQQEVRLEQGRTGSPTITVNGVYLHSRYNPEQEARRLVESAELDPGRPVLVLGLGLGYHVLALQQLGYEVAVADPNPAIVRLALEHLGSDVHFPLIAGDLEEEAGSPAFRQFAARAPQVFVHPAAARVTPGMEVLAGMLCRRILEAHHLSIAIVGPMYGGSLPITHYIADGFRALGHRVTVVDNSEAWPLYEAMTGSIRSRTASGQMGQMFANLLSEWSYARVVECDPEICLVLAQAPVGPQFAARLARREIISAFWYVENWRHLPYWQHVAPRYDSFFHIQPGEFEEKLDAAGCRHHAFVQTGCDPEKHRPVSLTPEDAATFSCDLSFAGAGYYNRLQVFRTLTDHHFKLWGVDWPDKELCKRLVGGEQRFDSETFMKIVAGSKINLNLHSSTTHEGVDPGCDAINPRVFEIAAAGGFQLCDACKGMAQHFDPETEVPLYENVQQLRAQIAHFLAHPESRAAFAARARERALAEHTYRHRAEQMLGHLAERHGTRILKRGVRIQRTVGEMRTRLPENHSLEEWLRELPEEVLFLQDAMMPFVKPGSSGPTYPEQLFTYMKEVREFADTMLKSKR